MASLHTQFGKVPPSFGLQKRPYSVKDRALCRRSVVRAQSTQEARRAIALPTVLASCAFEGAAHADEGPVDTTVNAIVDIVKAAGSAVKAGVSLTESAFTASKQLYTQVEPVVKQALDVSVPVVKSATEAAKPLVGAGIQATENALQAAGPTLESALSNAGVDTKAVIDVEQRTVEAGQEVVRVSKPLFESLITFVTTSEPIVVAEAALGLVAVYFLTGPLFGALGGALRGYAGDISPAAALDALASKRNTFLVDIRSEREKESSGLPDLPSNGRLIELEYATISDRKVRNQLRNAGDLELKVTSMQIASLKKLGKGSTVLLMDRNGSAAKAVARILSGNGFGKVFVVKGGFSGWQGAKLKVKPSNVVSRVEVLLPGVGGTGTRTQTRQIAPSPRQLQLPGGKK